MEFQKIIWSLNRSYLKTPITYNEVGQFNAALDRFSSAVNEQKAQCANKGQSAEESYKMLVSQFLRDTFYKKGYSVKPIDKCDLAIIDGGRVKVLFEVKDPTNKAEMCSQERMNTKALQEILLYFLREYIDKDNHYIKKLIITNIDEWFIFDARDFSNRIENNKDLLKEYADFRDGLRINTKTSEFYENIAPKYLDEFLKDIKITHFTLENLVQTFAMKDEKNEKYYYKFFSPENLLEKPFANDSNSLDKNFYNELLYIIGLEEFTEKGKKRIRRRVERKYGSLLECVIYQLEDKYSDEELYNTALGLCVVWINRLLFLKLLEASQLNFNNGDEEYRFLTTEKLSDFDMLNELFFKVLAKKPEDRHEQVKKAYRHLPYLNSSLFELSDEEEETHFQIRDIKQMPLDIYPKSVLYNNPKFKEKSLVNIDYLFRFLDAYNFASEGADEIQKESKSLINASVLGLIFEKINGYKDGAFFTPGYITQYIADEVVTKAVVNKFSEKTGNKYADLDEIKEDILDRRIARKEANAIVNSVKALDPAVGSGHFLVSVLNKLVQIKSYIGALLHPDGEYIAPSEFQVSVENDELSVVDRHGDLYFYKPKGAARKVQEALFHNKKEIIENCLFGVDINPNSVSICRLRLWIELLKHTYYDQDGNLQTLPNIDINIKAGNSLISKYEIKIGMSADRGSAYLKEKINRYKELVERYKNETDKNVKKEIKAEIVQIKTGCEKTVQCDIYGNEIVVNQGELSKNDKLYNHSMEWMIEFPEVLDDEGRFVGFDAVVGNPPYGVLNKKQNQAESIVVREDVYDYYKSFSEFASAQGGMLNIYRMFIVRSHSLLRTNGVYGQIFPLAFACDATASKVRKYVFENSKVIVLEAFPERDDVNKRVFPEVKMSVCVLITEKSESPTESFAFRISHQPYVECKKPVTMINYSDIEAMDSRYLCIPLVENKGMELLKKVYSNAKPFSDFGKCLAGEVDMTFCKDAFTNVRNKHRLLRGVNVGRYFTTEDISQGENLYIDVEKLKEIKKVDDDLFQSARIVMQGITGVNEKSRLKMTIASDCFCANSVNYCVLNKGENPYYCVGLLNSTLMNYLFKQFSTNSNVNGYEVDNLPICVSAKAQQKDVESLVKKILKKKEKDSDADVSKEESEIDKIVYELYGLNEEDILLVEGKYIDKDSDKQK